MGNSSVVALLLAALLLTSTYGGPSNSCVKTFDELEKAVLNNSDNVQALVRAFYQPNVAIPLSVRVVYQDKSMSTAAHPSLDVKWNHSTNTTFSTDQSCPAQKEIWLWVSSPMFIFVEPTKLNLCALFTLNFFRPWIPPNAHIYVPVICNETDSFNFLNELTLRVHIYAAKHLNAKDDNIGFVLHGCGDEVLTTLLRTTQKNNDRSMHTLAEASICIYMAGNFFVIFGGLLMIWVLLHKYGDILTRTNPTPSFDNYGLFWGFVTLSVLANPLLTAHTWHIVTLYFASGVYNLIVMGVVVLVQLVIVVSSPLIVALWFSHKLSLDIPFIYLCLLPPLFCISAEGKKKTVVFFSLWSLIQCVLHLLCYVPFLFLALLASPPTVIFTLLIYITTAFCFEQFLAASFILCKAVKRDQNSCCRMVSNVFHIVWYVLLCVAFLCVITLISAAGAVANYGSTAWNSNFSVASFVLSTVAPVPILWGLRKISMLWLQHYIDPPSNDDNGQFPQDTAVHSIQPPSRDEDTQMPQDAARLEMNERSIEPDKNTPLLAN